MRYIIMCGGNYHKWSTPRQLTEICGEPIVARTIRLLRESGAGNVAISSNDSRFDAFGAPVLHHENGFSTKGRGSWVDGFYPTAEPACYIMGDVAFSPEAVRTIVETETNNIMFFASSPPFSEYYIKRWAEPFAFKVTDQSRFRKAIEYVRENEHTGVFFRPPISWELWQVINGENPQAINYHNYTAINDYTCDIDEPDDARKIEEAIKRWTSSR